MAAIRKDGMALEDAGPFKEDPEVVMAAVLENGSALKYADQFKEDREIVMAAVQKMVGRLNSPKKL